MNPIDAPGTPILVHVLASHLLVGPSRCHLLLNTAGGQTAREAVLTAQLARGARETS